MKQHSYSAWRASYLSAALAASRVRFQYHVGMTMKEAAPLYDRDFFEWTARNAQLLREGRLTEVDAANLAEEIEDVGKRDQREVRSCLRVLLADLLKWAAQPGLRYAENGASSWLETVVEQRSQLESIFEQSPSLERHARESLDATFRKAVKEATHETKLPRSKFPAASPFAFEQIIDEDFLPD